jgi:hypothetical protein
VPTTQDLLLTLTGAEPQPSVKDFVRSVVAYSQGLHWPLAFAQVFQQGGFSVMLGNPPWERIKLQEHDALRAKSQRQNHRGSPPRARRLANPTIPV